MEKGLEIGPGAILMGSNGVRGCCRCYGVGCKEVGLHGPPNKSQGYRDKLVISL